MNTVSIERLKGYDIIVSIDRSGSMSTPLGTGTRWTKAQESTAALIRETTKIDADGVTLSLFGGKEVKVYENVKDADVTVNQIFTENVPFGGTPTAEMLQKHFDNYFAAKAAGTAKPIIIAVVTDGEPSDTNAVMKAIVDATNKMDSDDEIGITFLQVGEDPQAAAFLKKLDDELVDTHKAKFDIVNTENLEDVSSVVECLCNALDD